MRLSHGHPHSADEAPHWKATMLLNMIGIFSLLDGVGSLLLLSYYASSFSKRLSPLFSSRQRLVLFLRLSSLLFGILSPFLVGGAASLLLAISQYETEVECELGDEIRVSLLGSNLTDDTEWSSLVHSSSSLLGVEEPLLDSSGLASLYALVLSLSLLKIVSSYANWVPSLLHLPVRTL